MKNITLAIDEDVLDKVRIVAAETENDVNALVREFLADLAGRDESACERLESSFCELMRNFQGPHAARLEVRPRGNP